MLIFLHHLLLHDSYAQDQRPQTSDPSDLYIEVEENAGDHFVERIEDHKPTSKHVDRGSSGVVLTLERH